MIDNTIESLVSYAQDTGLIDKCEKVWAINSILEVMKLTGFQPDKWDTSKDISEILYKLVQNAIERGIVSVDSITEQDIFDTEIMGRLTPRPKQVIDKFYRLYGESPKIATDWYYQFSQDTNYIRRDRIAKDIKWVTDTEYGILDITINLSKPEKDPKAIAAARANKSEAYPSCQLCTQNEGYHGRLDHPARSNHRIIPITINSSDWFLQYSPYVYYNEHCIALNAKHVPMKIDRDCFVKLLDFTKIFPHYFVGSNADLPIVGGSILSHDHFQGGHYTFPMERAPIETECKFKDYPDVTGGIVKWPLSVIRISAENSDSLINLADEILNNWRNYTDESAFIFAETNGEPHNTITPIARMRDGRYELDLVLRNNITTDEFELGYYHAHPEHHHLKKENIGLIEVMGLAVLPARLLTELNELAAAILSNQDLKNDEATAKHAAWAEGLKAKYTFTAENAMGILQKEVGLAFSSILEQCGVFSRDKEGKNAFVKFLNQF